MTEAARALDVPADEAPRVNGAREGGFAYSGTELDAMASAPNYYRAIHSWFQPYLGRHVVEVGAGVGTFSALLAGGDDVERLTLVEPAENNFPILRERFAGDQRVVATKGFLEDISGDLRANPLALVNVLEHIEHDARFVAAAREVLAPSGHLLIFVPALPILFGALDEAFDHYRRYTRRTLRSLLVGGGFEPLEIRYVNLPGALSWFVAGRIFRRATLGAREVRAYDRWVVPSMLRMERVWSPPFGQSLLAIAKAAEK
jgi:SAM-dependent methyltransferase